MGPSLYQRVTAALRGFSLLVACALVFAFACGLLGEGSSAKFTLLLFGVSKLAVGAFVGYWIDRALFPYARPHEYFDDGAGSESANLFAFACIRRVLIVCACIIAAAFIA